MTTRSHKKTSIKKPQSPYSRYFKTLLILSTIGTSLSLLGGLLSLPQIGSSFSIGLGYGLLTVVSYLTAIVAAVGVWYLWKKQPIGLVLKLTAYGVTVATSIIMLYIDKPVIAATVERVREQTALSGKVVNDKLIDSVVNLMFSFTYVGAVIVSVTFGLLWWYAWKSQQKHDQK